MAQEQRHTPLRVGANIGYSYLNGVQILNEIGLVAAVAIGDAPELHSKEFAAFIVKAANAHDALVDALRDLISRGCPICEGDCSSASVAWCPMQPAIAALKLAEGK